MEHTQLEQLLDREAIRDCIYRYCRGIDRADEEALRSAYWPDAHDSHGAYNGPAEGFIARVLEVFKKEPRNVHQVSNILIEFLEPGVAAVESYFLALQRGPDREGVTRQVLLSGRYCDRFEKRDGEWRVAHRTVVYDWVDEQTPPTSSETERFKVRQPIGTAYPNDPIYALLNGPPTLKP
ncbi:nuclear transport factor 2 family protein [Mesorhizobium sp. CAU 1741]|uniref:nuclear transport factor 2 family protein n=1 Tax=Mesorhizobium sp. CAU 1741 TaxID=3140366 RepID=UPI00325AE0BF